MLTTPDGRIIDLSTWQSAELIHYADFYDDAICGMDDDEYASMFTSPKSEWHNISEQMRAAARNRGA